ncbi:MAG: MarR family transcriptional regulator [Methanobrevibacter olleyae]|uniref:MarR family transcriptional regulator n=1 Tax=Methanobrevibacter olleyae TaxID=294671 RepID=A0A8T3VZ19_METOL|nr:MarR family transcriptional regulator [Methanobrevibacter olleyae]
MSLERFKEMDALEFPLGKLITMIARGHSFYLNHRLEDLNINASQLHSLFEIKCSNGLNQDEIAKRCNLDKGSVARSLRKLEEKELIVKEIDENNRRQNKISLTSKGEYVIEESLKILDDWENEIFKEIDEDEKRVLQEFLKDTVIKTITLNLELKNKK